MIGKQAQNFLSMKDGRKIKTYISTPGSGTTNFLKYYPERKILEIGFRSNEVYQYFKVPSSVWDEYREIVLSGDSSGVFFNNRIKDKYLFRKIS